MSIKRLIAPASSAQVDLWHEKVCQIINRQDYANVLDFGAKGNGTTDDTTAMQAALDSGETNIYMPPGVYRCDKLALTTKTHLFGAGMGISFIYSTATGTDDGLVLQPDANAGEGWYLHDFSIYQDVDGNGRHGLLVWLPEGATYYFANFCFDRIGIERFGSQGLAIKNDYQNTNGIYLGTVKRCYFDNGVLLDYIGDSISIEQNRINGDSNVGIYVRMIPGSRQTVIRENNITNDNGGIAIVNAYGVKVYNNQIEGLSGTDYSSNYESMVYVGDSDHCTIRDNTITANLQTTKPGYGIVVDAGSTYTEITGNEVAKGFYGHYYIAAGCLNSHVGRNTWTGGALSYSDNGTDTQITPTLTTTAASSGTDGTISSRSANPLGECDGFVKMALDDGSIVYVPYWEDIAP